MGFLPRPKQGFFTSFWELHLQVAIEPGIFQSYQSPEFVYIAVSFNRFLSHLISLSTLNKYEFYHMLKAIYCTLSSTIFNTRKSFSFSVFHSSSQFNINIATCQFMKMSLNFSLSPVCNHQEKISKKSRIFTMQMAMTTDHIFTYYNLLWKKQSQESN